MDSEVANVQAAYERQEETTRTAVGEAVDLFLE